MTVNDQIFYRVSELFCINVIQYIKLHHQSEQKKLKKLLYSFGYHNHQFNNTHSVR